MEKFKVGDVVYDSVNYGSIKGEVINIILNNGDYCVDVLFEDNRNPNRFYNQNGCLQYKNNPTLSFTPYEVITEFKGFSQERPKVLTNEMKVCIKGDGTAEYGKKIIEYLKSLGGNNNTKRSGNGCEIYAINEFFDIYQTSFIPQGYKEITLKDEVEQELKVGIILVAIDNLYMNINYIFLSIL